MLILQLSSPAQPLQRPLLSSHPPPFPLQPMAEMDTQTTQTSRAPFASRPKLSLPGASAATDSSQQTTTTSSSGIRMLGDSDTGNDDAGGMIQLVGGEDDLNATFQISAAGTLRTHGFVLKSSGIQAQPERRHNHPQQPASASAAFLAPAAPTAASAASSSSSSSGAGSPGSPDGLPVFNPADLAELGSVGKGACGVVKRAVHVPSLRILALKSINIFESEKRHQFVKELSALSSAAGSPHIVGFAGAYFSEGAVTILLEYANRHSLLDQLKLHGPMPELLLARIALHSFRGLEALHRSRVIHRDIKPGNILIDSSAVCKLTDFGVVTALEGTMDLASTFVGTTIFMAPERVDAAGTYSYPSDVWSLGISLFYLATGQLPYDTSSGYWGIVKAIRDDAVPVLPKLQPGSGKEFSLEFRNFIQACMHKDPKARATASELLSFPFVAGADAKWSEALKGSPDGILHPLMKVTGADLSDLDALLAALYASVYAKVGSGGRPGPKAEYRKSLMDQARLQRLAEASGNHPEMDLAFITKRFEKLYAERREQGR